MLPSYLDQRGIIEKLIHALTGTIYLVLIAKGTILRNMNSLLLMPVSEGLLLKVWV